MNAALRRQLLPPSPPRRRRNQCGAPLYRGIDWAPCKRLSGHTGRHLPRMTWLERLVRLW